MFLLKIVLLSLLVSVCKTTKVAPDGHRCGICPTYFQKICAFEKGSKTTTIFDNHCVMDLYNCKESTAYVPMPLKYCMYFSNFGYVHGLKNYDQDYDDRDFVLNVKKNPDFM